MVFAGFLGVLIGLGAEFPRQEELSLARLLETPWVIFWFGGMFLLLLWCFWLALAASSATSQMQERLGVTGRTRELARLLEYSTPRRVGARVFMAFYLLPWATLIVAVWGR